jgi:LacI family transcriptional regulator
MYFLVNVYIVSVSLFLFKKAEVFMRPKTDIRHLAELTGVSIATVSRALNIPERVNPETRARILKAAEGIGYQVNSLGRRLRRGQAELVGMVIPVPPSQFGHPFFLELIAGLGEGFEGSGLELVVSACPPGNAELETYRRLIEGKRVDAMVVTRTRIKDERILYLLEQKIPFVTHGRSQGLSGFAFLDMNSQLGFADATRFLIELGHTQIALFNAPSSLNFSAARLAGYQTALQQAGIALDPSHMLETDLTEKSGYNAMQQLLCLKSHPSAVLCANDLIAIGAMQAVREAGLSIAQDISIIGYDDIPMAAYTNPPLTTIQQPTRAAGRKLAQMLLELMAGKTAESLQEVWTPQLIKRASHGKRRT